MLKSLKKIILLASLLLMFCAGQVLALDENWETKKYGLEEAYVRVNTGQDEGNEILYNKIGSDPQVIVSATQALSYVLSFIGVLFFLLVLYSGILWMTAGGKAEQAEKAKDMLISSFLGVVIVLSAYTVASFVFKTLLAG